MKFTTIREVVTKFMEINENDGKYLGRIIVGESTRLILAEETDLSIAEVETILNKMHQLEDKK